MPEITFDKEVLDPTILDVHDWHSDSYGYVRDSAGNYAPSVTGEPVHVDRVGGIVWLGNGPMIVRDNFADIVKYLVDHDG